MNKGEIWLVELPASNGYEQAGTRPVIILADTESNITIIIPFTSNIQALRFPNTIEIAPSKENGLNGKSIALIFQIFPSRNPYPAGYPAELCSILVSHFS